MKYNSEVKRFLRTLKRWKGLGDQVKPLSKVKYIKCFWWDKHSNFGDRLTEMILIHKGVVPLLTSPKDSDLLGIGSVIEMTPHNYSGVVWSSGSMYGDPQQASRPHATFLALRGSLSRELLGVDAPVALGDGGLLMPRVVAQATAHQKIGFVPHISHKNLEFSRQIMQVLADRGVLIDVENEPHQVVAEISACRAIITTSLHGLIIADSYGIPAAWALPHPVLEGGDFKFRDYESVFPEMPNRRVDIEDLVTVEVIERSVKSVDAEALEEICCELESSLDKFIEGLPHRYAFQIFFQQLMVHIKNLFEEVSRKPKS